jgi:hypothetical protein
MSSTKRKLAVVPSRHADQPRLQLAASIKNAAKAKAALASHQQAIQRAGEQLAEAERKVEQARAGIDAAKTAFAGELADALARGSQMPATSSAVRAAEAAVVDAQRTAEAVRVARDRLKADLSKCEADVTSAEKTISAQIAAVTSPAIEELVAHAEQALSDLSRYAAVLRYLSSPDDDPADRGGGHGRPIRLAAELHTRVTNLLNSRSVSLLQFNLSDEVRTLVQQWRETRARLRANADLPLPPLPGDACTGSREESSA